MKNFKLDLSVGQITSFVVVVTVCVLAFVSTNMCHQQLKRIISQNERIQINLSKTENNSDLQKLLAEYHINNANYSKQFYEKQSDWINIWLLVVGILLTTMAIIAPLRFSANIKQIRKDGDDVIKEIKLRNIQISQKLKDENDKRNSDLIKFRLENRLLLELQWFGFIATEQQLQQYIDNTLLIIDTECTDNQQDTIFKNNLYAKVFLNQSRWYTHNKTVPETYKKSIECIDKALFYSPNDVDLYIQKSYIIATGNEEYKYNKVIELLENVLTVKNGDIKISALNTIYYNLAEAYILSGINNNLLKAINLLAKIDTTKIHKNVLIKDFMVWKQKLQNMPDSDEKQQIMKFIDKYS